MDPYNKILTALGRLTSSEGKFHCGDNMGRRAGEESSEHVDALSRSQAIMAPKDTPLTEILLGPGRETRPIRRTSHSRIRTAGMPCEAPASACWLEARLCDRPDGPGRSDHGVVQVSRPRPGSRPRPRPPYTAVGRR